ncbi:unnamed protein product [Caenorhabditis nigoni]
MFHIIFHAVMCHNESHADRQFGLNKKLENFVLVTILDSDLQSKPLLSIHEASIVAKACFRTGEVELKSMHPFWLRNGRKTPMTVQFSLWSTRLGASINFQVETSKGS